MKSQFVIDINEMKPLIHSNRPVVVLDDDIFQISLVKECYSLSGRKNELICFSNSDEFLAYYTELEEGKKTMPELILLDINMPKLNGFDILNYLKKKVVFNDIPIIVMFTASDSEQDKDKARSMKADGYLSKPYSINDYIKFFKNL